MMETKRHGQTALVAALTLALRRRGVTIPPGDAANIILLLPELGDHNLAETKSILQAALGRNAAEAAVIAAEFEALLKRPDLPPPSDVKPPDGPNQKNTTVHYNDESSSIGRFLIYFIHLIQKHLTIILITIVLMSLIVFIYFNLKIVPDHDQFIEWINSTINFREREPINGGTVSSFTRITGVIAGATVASVITGLIVLGLNRWRPHRSIASEGEAAPSPRRLVEHDESCFRAGTIGGTAPAFINKAAKAQIAALFGYRPGGPDETRIDVNATIAERISRADECLIQFGRRRELPTILTLVDQRNDTHLWNTLADEFSQLLRERGVLEQRIHYPGTLHQGLSPTAPARPAGKALIDALTAPGWTVTIVFGDAAGLSRRDRDLLKLAAENGPLVFLDMQDPALWNARHAWLAAAGIDLYPATASGLTEGLARVFAPHLSKRPMTAGAKIEPPNGQTPAALPAFTLTGDALDWASECALVEPIAFALAEELRTAHPSLGYAEPNLSYSRLVALPGSWVGPEGLRFDPATRRALLSHFSSRPRHEKQAVVARLEWLIDQAGEQSPGSTADIQRDYIKHVIRIVGLSSDESWQALREMDRAGAMAKTVIPAFMSRLQPAYEDPGDDPVDLRGAEAIRLSEPPETAAMRDWLDHQASSDGSGPRPSPPRRSARWRLDVPESRIVLGEVSGTTSSPSIDPAPTMGAFLGSGRHLLIGGGRPGWGGRCQLLDVVAGQVISTPQLDEFDNVVSIISARDAPVAVAFTANQACLVINAAEMAQARGAQLSVLPNELVSGDSDQPVTAVLSPDGSTLYIAQETLLRRLDVSGDVESPKAIVAKLASPATSMTMIGSQDLLIGLADGDVIYFGGGNQSPLPLLSLGSPAVALSATGIPNALAGDAAQAAQFLLAAATLDGRLVMTDGENSLEHRLGNPVSRIALLSNRPCIRLPAPFEDGQAAREVGQSVAVMYRGGGLDVLGMPDPAPTALFRSMSILDGRLNGTSQSPRAIALGGISRRVAMVAGGRLTVRTMIYTPPPALAGNVRAVAVERELT